METSEREIVLDAPPEEVWEALTDPEQLEEWFANDVEFDLERGGVFRWDDGEVRHAVVEEVDAERRLAIRWWDPDGPEESEVTFTLVAIPAGTRLVVTETASCDWAWAIQAMREDAVFSALSDPSRRHLLESLAGRESASLTELAAQLPVTRQAVSKHLAALGDAGLVEAQARRSRDALPADPAAARARRSPGWSGSATVGRAARAAARSPWRASEAVDVQRRAARTNRAACRRPRTSVRPSPTTVTRCQVSSPGSADGRPAHRYVVRVDRDHIGIGRRAPARRA